MSQINFDRDPRTWRVTWSDFEALMEHHRASELSYAHTIAQCRRRNRIVFFVMAVAVVVASAAVWGLP